MITWVQDHTQRATGLLHQQFRGQVPPPEQALLDISFDALSGESALDASGNEHHHLWVPGDPAGSHASDPDIAPTGGQSIVAGTGSGFRDTSWTGLEYIGDNSGFNSDSLTFDFVVELPTLAVAPVLYEIPGAEADSFIRLQVNTDGSLEFQIQTSAIEYAFTAPIGTIEAGNGEYRIQFVISNNGQDGLFYAAPCTEAFSGALLTTRTAL